MSWVQKQLASRVRSFGYAFEGWWYALRTQPNTWIHALATVVAVALAVWLKISSVEWALIVVAIVLVWTAEFFNTAVESIVDLASPEVHPLAKAAKDVAAAAVLIGAGGAVLIAAFVFLPRLFSLMG